MSDAPFKVGDRVRLKPSARKGRLAKHPFGVVVSVAEQKFTRGSMLTVHIKRDGLKHMHKAFILSDRIASCRWEIAPLEDWTADQTAEALVEAFKNGNKEAAILLADRIFELCGGATRTPPRAIAEIAASKLFINGAGESADSLVLTSKEGRNLGGMCRGHVVDQIEAAIRDHVFLSTDSQSS